jgi:hypothetical protein
MAGLRWIYALNSPLNHSDPTGLRFIIADGGGDYTPAPAYECDRGCGGDYTQSAPRPITLRLRPTSQNRRHATGGAT